MESFTVTQKQKNPLKKFLDFNSQQWQGDIMNKNWTISNGTLYRANHNGTARGYMVGNVKHLTESQLAEILKAANEEKKIKLKVAKAKELIGTGSSGPKNWALQIDGKISERFATEEEAIEAENLYKKCEQELRDSGVGRCYPRQTVKVIELGVAMSGPELQAIRKNIQGIQWFADKLGVSQSTLESYECGRLPIPAERVRRAKEIAEKAKAI